MLYLRFSIGRFNSKPPKCSFPINDEESASWTCCEVVRMLRMSPVVSERYSPTLCIADTTAFRSGHSGHMHELFASQKGGRGRPDAVLSQIPSGPRDSRLFFEKTRRRFRRSPLDWQCRRNSDLHSFLRPSDLLGGHFCALGGWT